MAKLSWNQPICDEDWEQRNPGRVPVTIAEEYRETERCAFCGQETRSGIFVRQDPATVAYPHVEED